MTPERWQRIQELFHEAEGLATLDQSAYLERACGRDLTLRKQVETLLAHDQTFTTDLQAMVGQAAIEIAEPVEGQVGNYTIVRRIGEGGMGVVFEAEQMHPRRRVALKVIRAGRFATERTHRLFQREAEVLGRLQHPGIATIYESGVMGDQQPFLAMELVTGRPLDQWLEQEQPPRSLRRDDVAGRLRLFRAICDAINYAHQNGVIHRDLKPSNIFILEDRATQPGTQSGSSSRALVKILDFGLARVHEQGDATVLTEAGMVQGSVPYMSPEQARGETHRVDMRSDIYALGIVLYELLTHRHPYLDRFRGLAEALPKILDAAPRPMREFAGRVDDDLETITRKALEKDPAQRYQSVSALVADLDRYVADLPIVARPPSTWYQVRKLIQRHRTMFGAALLTLVLLVAFTITTLVQSRQIRAERDRANREAESSRQIADFLTDLFRKANPAESKGVLTARDLLRAGKERVRRELGKEPEIQARLLETIGDSFNVVGPLEEAKATLEESIRLRERLDGPEAKANAKPWSSLSDTYFNLGDFRNAVLANRRALAIREKHLGPDHAEVAKEQSTLAMSLVAAGELAEARQWMERAVASDRRTNRGETEDGGTRMETLAMVLRRSDDFSGAARAAAEAVRILKKTAGESATGHAYNELGIALKMTGRWAEAEEAYRTAIRIAEPVYGADHPNLAVLRNNLATTLSPQGKYAEAEELARRSLEAFQKAMGNNPRGADLHVARAEALLGLRRYTDARGEIERALALNRGAYGEKDWRTRGARVWLGRLELASGRPAAALEQAAAALADLDSAGRTRMEAGYAYRLRGQALAAQGDLAGAAAAFEQSLEAFTPRFGKDYFETRESAGLLAGVFVRHGKKDRALEIRARYGVSGDDQKR